MSYADIDKWISGEIEVFDPHQIALPGCDSNPQKESLSMQPAFRRFTHPAIAIVVVALGIGTLVGSVISTRYSVEPLAAAMSAHSGDTTAIDDPQPNLHQRTTTLPHAGLAASLKDGMDPSLLPLGAFAPLPPPEPVTRPAPPEPPSEMKQEYPRGRPAEASARAPRVDKLGGALSAVAPSGPRSTKLPSDPLWSDGVARLPISEAAPLTERAKAFIKSYWQTVDDSGDRVLPYLSSVYAPMVTYYGKLLPKRVILRDKYYFLRRWPIRQTWSTPGVERPSISCSEAVAKCEISGMRDFKAMSAERGARATGVVRYWYAVRFLNGSPQIIVENSTIVVHD
jgi:hypothetical protein